MPHRNRSSDEARQRLDARLEAFEAQRERKPSAVVSAFTGEGYRFLGEVVSGVLGGAGFGWLFDRYVTHAPPAGLIGGLLIGTGASIFIAVRQAARAAKQSAEQAGPLPSVPDDDEND